MTTRKLRKLLEKLPEEEQDLPLLEWNASLGCYVYAENIFLGTPGNYLTGPNRKEAIYLPGVPLFERQ